MIDEDEIINLAKPQILRCRPGDWNHAKRVVKWVKILGEERDDLYLLVTAGYIHDIGWQDLVDPNKKLSKEKLKSLQKRAGERTEKLTTPLLQQLRIGKNDIFKILRLVRATESYTAKQDDEEILVDADNLSKTEIDHFQDKYLKSEWLTVYDWFAEVLPDRIKTKRGKELFEPRLEQLKVKLKHLLSE